MGSDLTAGIVTGDTVSAEATTTRGASGCGAGAATSAGIGASEAGLHRCDPVGHGFHQERLDRIV